MRAARFVDIGLVEPALFHATYTGIADVLQRDDPPVVMWGRSPPHISLGQSQDRCAELAAELEVPVITRPLGGGAVWVDESQYCFVLIVPLEQAPPRPADWFGWGLAPALATYHHFGLPVGRCEQDLWLAGRKIAGSGAATIGCCAVFASSFLLRFPAERFARCIASPSSEFRAWLLAALAQAMTDWESHQPPPGENELRAAFRDAVEKALGWQLADSALSAAEFAAREDALLELPESAQAAAGGTRMVKDGLKLKAGMFLHERRLACGTELSLVRDGTVVRQQLRTD
ncbi:MAG: hypothetical protein Q8K18_07815 [Burkholderiales bacterium]|nr:hypothetical protein [Burkholderiales bacterium]